MQSGALPQKKRPKSLQAQNSSNVPHGCFNTSSAENLAYQENRNTSHPRALWEQQIQTNAETTRTHDSSYDDHTQYRYHPNRGLVQSPQSPSESMYLNTPTGHSMHGLSAIMFPSPDPFMYPNQPITSLDCQQQIKQEEPMGPSTFFSSSSMAMDGSMYGTVPNYPTRSAAQEDLFGSPVYQGPDHSTFPQNEQIWPTQHQQPDNEATMMEMGQLYGEDWGGWMQQGSRQ